MIQSSFEFFPKQQEAFQLLKGPQAYTLLHGGGGSGKTAVICYALILRCLAIPDSTHGVFRRTGVSLRNSVFNDTFKKVLRTFYEGKLFNQVKFIQDDMEVTFPNGAKILFAGLDNPERIERLFGMEYTTVWVNEISEISDYQRVIGTLMFRLRQPSLTVEGKRASHKFWMDCNPPSRSHWARYAFFSKLHPVTKAPFKSPDEWQQLSMNTTDNPHLDAAYIERMREGYDERTQRRLIEGEWLNDDEGALFKPDDIAAGRISLSKDQKEAEAQIAGIVGNLNRIVVSVDPAMTNTVRSDEHGITVSGIDDDEDAYVLEDASFKGSPQALADKVAGLFRKWNANLIVVEVNQGGDMVEHVLRTGGYAHLPIKKVRAFQNKHLRAEPISGPYEKHRVHHVGYFPKLEDQMEAYTLDWNRSRQGSPDRLDALVYGLTELLGKQHKPSRMSTATTVGLW